MTDSDTYGPGPDSQSIDALVRRMRHQALLRQALLTVFLFNALAAMALGIWLAWTRTPPVGFSLAALSSGSVSLVFLAYLWREANRRRRLARSAAGPARQFVGKMHAETVASVRERKVVGVMAAFVLTPLFVLAESATVRAGDMSFTDALFATCLYAAALSVVLVVSRERIARLRRRQAQLRELLVQFGQ